MPPRPSVYKLGTLVPLCASSWGTEQSDQLMLRRMYWGKRGEDIYGCLAWDPLLNTFSVLTHPVLTADL